MAERNIQPVIKPSAGILIAILLILLASAIGLLVLASSRQQVVASYVLFALVAAVVTFGFLGATGSVKTRGKQLGGSAAVFAIILGMLLPFAREATVDIRGMLYLDGKPSGAAEIYLLETNTTPNRYVLEEHHKGHFEFRDVTGAKGDVRFSIDLPGYEEKVVTCPHKSGDVVRIELSTRDLKSVIATEGKLDVFPTGIELLAVNDTSDTELKTICVHSFVSTTGQPQYDELGTAIAANVAARLEDAPGVQVADRTTLRDVMQKLGLQKSEPMDEEVARMLGKLVGTNFSLVGSNLKDGVEQIQGFIEPLLILQNSAQPVVGLNIIGF